jgi:hypothetical protein
MEAQAGRKRGKVGREKERKRKMKKEVGRDRKRKEERWRKGRWEICRKRQKQEEDKGRD